MIVKISDIPIEGRELQFQLDPTQLGARLEANRLGGDQSVAAPEYKFIPNPTCELRLELEGSTVLLDGRVVGEVRTPCARCAEDTVKSVSAPLKLVLKPHTGRGKDTEFEDLSFGYYDGEQVDCSAFAEEFLILALPFAAYCRPDCKGLCPHCGVNLNQESCRCESVRQGDERLAILRNLKVN